MSASILATIKNLWETEFQSRILKQIQEPLQTVEQKDFLDLKAPYTRQIDKTLPTDKPRRLPLKTPFKINEEQVKQYEKLFFEYSSSLKHVDKIAAYALLMANFHFIQEMLTEPTADKRGFFVLLKEIYKKKNCKISESIFDKMKVILDDSLPNGYTHPGFEKRMDFNRHLPVDNIESPSIQALIKQGYETIYINIKKNDKLARIQNGEVEIPTEYVTLQENCIVIDKATNKVLAVLHKKAISKECIDELASRVLREPDSFWRNSIRGDVNRNAVSKAGLKVKYAKTEEIKKEGEKELASARAKAMNKGHQASLGLNNHQGLTSAMLTLTTRASTRTMDLWRSIFNDLSLEVVKKYGEILPITYQGSLSLVKELQQERGDEWFSPKCPFSTVSINRSNAIKPHRDLNLHNYSAMVVMVCNESQTTKAGTCFLEWFDDKTGLPIEFIVNHRDLLLADTDYLHIAHNTELGDGRYSIVFYTGKRLLTRPVFACGDSDVEMKECEKLDPEALKKETLLGSFPLEEMRKHATKRSYSEISYSDFSDLPPTHNFYVKEKEDGSICFKFKRLKTSEVKWGEGQSMSSSLRSKV